MKKEEDSLKLSRLISISDSNESIINIGEKTLDIGTSFSKNEMLCEYFLKIKKVLKCIFTSALVAELNIFKYRDGDVATSMKLISTHIPIFGSFILAGGISLQIISQKNLKNKLSKIADLASAYSNFEDVVARAFTLLRREVIIATANPFFDFDKASITDKFVAYMSKKKLSPTQILAVNDSQILEGCLLFMMETKQVNLVELPKIEILVGKIIENLLFYKNNFSISFGEKIEIPEFKQIKR